ncbi:MAG: PadR family transcriptional regulator [Terriglobales bacterium]
MGAEALQGALALLVLKTLSRAPKAGMHGFGIAVHIQAGSQELLRVEEGSLYPALHRMEQAGWIRASWGRTENQRRARYYRLTPAGRKRLEQEQRSWQQVTSAVAAFLGA